jgi:hypothetical protein
MSKAKLAKGALGFITDLFEPVAIRDKKYNKDLDFIPPMWESQANPSPYFSSTSKLLDNFPPTGVPRTGAGYADWLEAQARKGKITKSEGSYLNIAPVLRELGPTPISTDKVKNLAESRSVNIEEKLAGPTTAIKAIDEQINDLRYELTKWVKSQPEYLKGGFWTGEAGGLGKVVQRQIKDLEAKKAELINREVDAGTYNQAGDIDRFAMSTRGSWWLPDGTGHRELRINSPHVSYSQVKPTETAAAPFIDDFNRLNKEIEVLEHHQLEPSTVPEGMDWNDISEQLYLLKNQREFLHKRMVDATVAENPSLYGHQIWKDNHWPDDENVLAHIRFSDRVGPDGEKILVIEELQSTIHQMGVKRNYAKQISPPEAKPLTLDEYKELQKFREELKYDWEMQRSAAFQNLEQRNLQWTRYRREMEELDRPLGYTGASVPDLPYKKDWHELALRRGMQLAAREGYDRVAFVPFRQQMARSDESKIAHEIIYQDGKLSAYSRLHGTQLLGDGVEFVRVGKNEVKNWIGEDAAKQLFSDPDYAQLFGEFKGIYDGVEVGGKFFRDLYDSKVPKYLKKISGSEIEMKPTHSLDPSGWKPASDRSPEIIDLPTVEVNAETIKKLTGDGIKHMGVAPVAALPALDLDDDEADF